MARENEKKLKGWPISIMAGILASFVFTLVLILIMSIWVETSLIFRWVMYLVGVVVFALLWRWYGKRLVDRFFSVLAPTEIELTDDDHWPRGMERPK